MPKHRAGITSRGYRGHSSTLPFSPLSFGRFWQTPEGLDKNTFSVSGNVFFRLSWTSEYAMQHVAWKSPASGGIGSILFASPLISSGGNLGLCDLASGIELITDRYGGRLSRSSFSPIRKLQTLHASFSMAIRAGPFRIVDLNVPRDGFHRCWTSLTRVSPESTMLSSIRIGVKLSRIIRREA